ncbi:MAG TPA: hypothetical protein VN662_08770 [Rhodanobacteraceae bacterium]|nr:hypothetical protein [Rhodanobacteraceae bacterium]
MSELAIAIPGFDSVQAYVRQARELALRNPEAWADALHDLTPAAENDVIFAAMDGDECTAGRRLMLHLRNSIIATATDKAKDALAEQLEVTP